MKHRVLFSQAGDQTHLVSASHRQALDSTLLAIAEVNVSLRRVPIIVLLNRKCEYRIAGVKTTFEIEGSLKLFHYGREVETRPLGRIINQQDAVMPWRRDLFDVLGSISVGDKEVAVGISTKGLSVGRQPYSQSLPRYKNHKPVGPNDFPERSRVDLQQQLDRLERAAFSFPKYLVFDF